jgi:hypothetical protein
MMRSGGGGGGLTRHYVIEPLKNLTLFTGAVYLIGGHERGRGVRVVRAPCGRLVGGYVATGASRFSSTRSIKGRCRCPSTWLLIRCLARRRERRW